MSEKLVQLAWDWLADRRGLHLRLDLLTDKGQVTVARKHSTRMMEVRLRFDPALTEPPRIEPLGASWGDMHTKGVSGSAGVLGLGLSGTEEWSRAAFEVQAPIRVDGRTEYPFQLNLAALRISDDAEAIQLHFGVYPAAAYLTDKFTVQAEPLMERSKDVTPTWQVAEYSYGPQLEKPPDVEPVEESASIFISYQRESESVAENVRQYLQQAGYEVWQDTQNIRHTDQWQQTIDQALRETDRLILLMTPKAMKSIEVFNEWSFFYRHRKPLHCLLLEDCPDMHYQLEPYQYIDWRKPDKWERLLKELQVTFTVPKISEKERVINSDFAPERSLPEAMQALQEALVSEVPVVLSAAQLKEITDFKPDAAVPFDEIIFRLGRYAAWCDAHYQLDERFVRLTMLLDQGDEAQVRWQAHTEQKRYSDLREILTEDDSHTLVLLGAPGAGKSTLLRRLEMDIASDAIRADGVSSFPLTFFVSLAEYGVGLPDEKLPLPFDWLSDRWQSKYPDLPVLDELLRQGKLLLLLDSLNEMPHNDQAHYRQRAALWRSFIHQYVRDRPGNRAIFACRSLDYGGVLSVKGDFIPQLRLEPMTPEQVQDYLDNYTPEHAAVIWDHFERDRRQFELFRIPFMLKMLVERVRYESVIPQGRAEVFSGFIRGLLHREVKADHPLFVNEGMLSARELMRYQAGRAPRHPHDLPEQGALIPGLVELAYTMQERKPGEEQGLVVVEYDDALSMLQTGDEDILTAGRSMGVLEIGEQDERVRYYHQLLQEYFAARRLAQESDPELVHVEWHVEHTSPALEEQLAQLADSDPLPLLPQTGWEETTLLAAAMTEKPDEFVRDLMETNLPLAARCGAAPDVTVSDALREDIRQALIARTQNPEADLRARIAAGLALGEVGDPRFDHKVGPYGEYFLPCFVFIPAGEYLIGCDHGRYADESPTHVVGLDAFGIGKFPVTNREYSLFIKSGGYEQEQWWATDSAVAWLKGTSNTEEQKAIDRDNWKILQSWSDERIIRGVPERFTSEQAQLFIWFKKLTIEQLEYQLDKWYPSGQIYHQPAFWNDDNYNNPAQPVVGICWYEASAYCAWLSAQANLDFRLPSEAEWEAAARGKSSREYPYEGEFDVKKGNTLEGHIRRTTPVGIFPGGETPEDLMDMSGNAWDWTSTIYTPYPYNSEDGREDVKNAESRLVVRGGSWLFDKWAARSSCRSWNTIDGRSIDQSFRLCCGYPLP